MGAKKNNSNGYLEALKSQIQLLLESDNKLFSKIDDINKNLSDLSIKQAVFNDRMQRNEKDINELGKKINDIKEFFKNSLEENKRYVERAKDNVGNKFKNAIGWMIAIFSGFMILLSILVTIATKFK